MKFANAIFKVMKQQQHCAVRYLYVALYLMAITNEQLEILYGGT
jgi:hypothetical protein